MPTPFDDKIPSEETEARLCAYLEGELAPDERADIELYLKNNPQHRQLLRELSATRFILQSLPKEKAPAEVAESFHGQMERSMLLDGANDVDPIVRINRWPQLALIAAMLVLATGLGVIVYIILPGPLQKYSVAPATVTVVTTPSGPPAAPTRSLETTPTIVPNEPSNKPLASAAPAPAVIASPPVVDQLANAKKDEDKALPSHENAAKVDSALATAQTDRSAKMFEESLQKEKAAEPAIRMRYLDKSVTDRLADAGLPEDLSGRLCVVVHTNDPAATGNQLRNYFALNSIPYQQMTDGIAAAPSASVNGANEPIDLKPTTTQPAGTLDTPAIIGGGGGGGAEKEKQQNNLQGGITLGAANPTTQPIPQLPSQNRDQIRATSENPVFVAKAMTQQEATQLRTVLSNGQPGQTAELFPAEQKNSELHDLNLGDAKTSPASQPTIAAGTPATPTTQPAAGEHALSPGDQLTITVAQLVGPGMDKTNTVKVAENGTIILPMIEPVPAVGLSTNELQKQIADKYREANLIPDAQVTVNALPTTQPADSAKFAATQPSDVQRVDVVVVIEKNAAGNTTQPTTAPAADMPGVGPMQP